MGDAAMIGAATGGAAMGGVAMIGAATGGAAMGGVATGGVATGGEFTAEVLAELAGRVTRALARWNLPRGTSIRLLNVSENATYALSDPRGRELVLRVHRVGYSSAEEIRSELQWMNALRRDGVIDTAAPVAGGDGELVQVLEPFTGGPPRFAVAFERLPGKEPDSREAVRWFARLGELTARMHCHAKAWALPAGFRRKRWDLPAMVGPDGFWGSWRAGIGLDAAGAQTLERVLALIGLRLERFGSGPDEFGLVHADLRLANLLVDGTHLRIIDFDDCGFCWFAYDFATAVSFIEHEPTVPDLITAWCAGYRTAAALSAATEAEIPTFVMLRRILLTAWLASHAEVPFARDFGASYTAGTVALAAAALRGNFPGAGI
ncbi:MAG: phosphotransferase [Steroidobacteraceae bacterium]|jgi:Ser/Thr protein kinase RdoA (MazF antagonist)